MKLNLNKAICFIDIESTGLNVLKDRIIQIAVVKQSPDEALDKELNLLINPGTVLISEDAKKVHGIDNVMLRNKPNFHEVADEIKDFIGNSDLAGYNLNRFDIPMLLEEFARCGVDFNLTNRKVVDVQVIFHKMESRTLGAAHRKFCGSSIENAHDAMSDVKATKAVLESMLDHYKGVDLITDDNIVKTPIKNEVDALHNFTQESQMLDATRRLKYDANKTVVFNFGKYIGKAVGKTVYEDRNYYRWIQDKDFSHQVKKLVTQLKDEYAKSKE